jgi:tyrosinase
MVPTAFVTEKVDVTKPDNTKVSIDNPLFDYNFHPKDNAEINGTVSIAFLTKEIAVLTNQGCAFPLAGGPLDNHFKMCNEAQTTVRKATDAARNVSNHVTLETQYKNLLGSIRQRTFSVMSKWQPFDSFANNGRCGDPASGSSLEGVHDTIHSEMAPAHMVPLAVSAFDPIFWMHHA